jgi:uncharacterized membrane protein YdjX (TVP38/TMEM64 family)
MSPKAKAALVIAVALLIPIVPFAVIGELPGEHWLSAADDNALLFGLTGGGLLAIDVLLPIPSSIVGTLLGARLGFLPGLLWSWTGLMIGNLVGYTTGRMLLARFGERLPRAPTLAALFLSRPVPVFAEAVTFTSGAERMPLGQFVSVCAAGNLIYALALAGNGAALLPDALAGPGLILPMALPVTAWYLWHRHQRGNPDSDRRASQREDLEDTS